MTPAWQGPPGEKESPCLRHLGASAPHRGRAGRRGSPEDSGARSPPHGAWHGVSPSTSGSLRETVQELARSTPTRGSVSGLDRAGCRQSWQGSGAFCPTGSRASPLARGDSPTPNSLSRGAPAGSGKAGTGAGDAPLGLSCSGDPGVWRAQVFRGGGGLWLVDGWTVLFLVLRPNPLQPGLTPCP